MLHQMRFDVVAQLRNPPVVFFGLALPVLFLLIFGTLFGGQGGGAAINFLVPGITTLGIVSTTFVNLAIGLTIQRESGYLKRLRATPVPVGAFLFGRIGVQVGFAVLITFAIVLCAILVFGAGFSPGAILPTAVVVAVGAATFSTLGIALSAAIPNGDAAPAIANLVALPLYFVSGVFFPVDSAPAWLNSIADVFPVKHLAEALFAAFGAAAPPVLEWEQLGLVAVWGVAAVLLSRRFFRWSPAGT